MANKNHTGFRNGDLFCFHCGESYKMNFPTPLDMAAAIMRQFEKSHKSCVKTWTEPVPQPEGKTVEENANWWLEYGERGTSSETMFHYLDGRNIRVGKHEGHPCDPNDFYRCHKLLQAVPQWKSELHKLKSVSAVWSNLVDNWDKLTEMLEHQIRTNKSNDMYAFMESLGC